jgi:hypothetical protein
MRNRSSMKHDTTEICSKQPRSKAYHLSALRDQSLGKFMHGREGLVDLEIVGIARGD